MQLRALVLLLALAAPALAARPTPADRARRLLEKRVPAGGPGVAVALLRGGNVVFQTTRGYADVGRQTSITSASLFDLASCSKQFTGLGIALLVADGKLALEDDIRKHLPELPQRKKPIRLRHLLAMTDGQLPSYDEEFTSFEGLKNVDIVKFVAKKKLSYPTGTKHEYSNTAYCELGLILARAGGGSYDRFLKSRIFGPAAMAATMALEDFDQTLTDRVTGYKDGKPASMPNWIVGDGNVFSTLDDLVRYDQALRRGVIPPAIQKITAKSGTLDDGTEVGYHYGLIPGKDAIGRWVCHAGGWAGTATYIARYLKPDGLSVIVLSNEEQLDVSGLGDKLLEIFRE